MDKMTTIPRNVRQRNRAAILRSIISEGLVTRANLAKKTGLIESTVSRIINDLLEEELVCESMTTTRSVGRNAANVELNGKRGYFGVIDVTRVRTFVALSDLGCEICKVYDYETPAQKPHDFFRRLAETVASMEKEFDRLFLGVSVILPCSVNTFEGSIYSDEVLGWENIPVKQILKQRIKGYVAVENNARAGALAEMYFAEEARDLSDFVFVSYRHGIGTGIVIAKEVYFGAHCMVGEFGANIIRINGKWKENSAAQSWESYASDIGTIKRYCELSGASPETDIDGQLNMIIEKAKQGDRNGCSVLRDTARSLGWGIANINWGLGPEKIIIGGILVNGWELIVNDLIYEVKKNTPYHLTPLNALIVPSSLANYTLDGARALILNKIVYEDMDSFL